MDWASQGSPWLCPVSPPPGQSTHGPPLSPWIPSHGTGSTPQPGPKPPTPGPPPSEPPMGGWGGSIGRDGMGGGGGVDGGERWHGCSIQTLPLPRSLK